MICYVYIRRLFSNRYSATERKLRSERVATTNKTPVPMMPKRVGIVRV